MDSKEGISAWQFEPRTMPKTAVRQRSITNYLLLILSLEKIIQYVVVSLSLFYDYGGVRSTIAVDYRALLVSGAVIAFLFGVAFLALIQEKRWGVHLLILLAAFDIVGEFVAQGTLFVTINISIIVASVTLLLCYNELRNLQKTKTTN